MPRATHREQGACTLGFPGHILSTLTEGRGRRRLPARTGEREGAREGGGAGLADSSELS